MYLVEVHIDDGQIFTMKAPNSSNALTLVESIIKCQGFLNTESDTAFEFYPMSRILKFRSYESEDVLNSAENPS